MNKDKIKERVRASIQKNIEQKDIVTSIDVLIDLERITKAEYEKLEYVYSLCYLKSTKKEKDVVKPAV